MGYLSVGKRRKTKIIAVRVTDVEFEKISQFAAEFDLPTGMYMRLRSLLGGKPYRESNIVVTSAEVPTVSGAVKVTGVKHKFVGRESIVERRRNQFRAGAS